MSDEIVRQCAPRLRFLPRVPAVETGSAVDDRYCFRSFIHTVIYSLNSITLIVSFVGFSSQPSSSNNDKSSYINHKHRMIVPIDDHWLNLMMGKRFHENLCNSYSNSENDSTSSYESVKPSEIDKQPSPSISTSTPRNSDAKADNVEKISELIDNNTNEATSICEESTPVPSLNTSLVQCSVKLDKISKEKIVDTNMSKSNVNNVSVNTHTTRIATMNLEVSKLSTKNIIEHSKIMSLQHMDSIPPYTSNFSHDMESSGDETSSRGTLDVIIPPLKDFQGKNNPFLMSYPSKKPFSTTNIYNKLNGKQNHHHLRFSLPVNLSPAMGPLVRPLKRKLCEKDIVIGPNGEVKRRKFRRPRKYLQAQVQMSFRIFTGYL